MIESQMLAVEPGLLSVEPGVLAAVCADRLLAELWDTRRRCLADEPVVYRRWSILPM